jgi:hypothetical protein
LQPPWLDLVEVDLLDDLEVELLEADLLLEVVEQQLVVGRVEPEPRRHAVARREGRHLERLLPGAAAAPNNEPFNNFDTGEASVARIYIQKYTSAFPRSGDAGASSARARAADSSVGRESRRPQLDGGGLRAGKS